MKNIQTTRVTAGAALWAVVASVSGLGGCLADVPQLAPSESVMTLFANPTFIPANGGVSVISAVITEAAGTPVPDGTVVQFFTDLGMVDREGLTKDGVARVNFISDARSGTANVTAVSGPITGTVPGGIRIGGVVATRMIVTADPVRINLAISRTTHIFATVLDADGNPVPNIGVIFTTETPATDTMDSQGHPVFTDNNGRAEDVLRTRRTTPGTVRVTATTLDGVTGSVTVPVIVQ
jgi:hypothetical protein